MSAPALPSRLSHQNERPGREAEPIRRLMALANFRSVRAMIAPVLPSQDHLFLRGHPDQAADLSGNQAKMHAGQVLQDQTLEAQVNQGDMAESLIADPAADLLM